jgi:hypothetical protein
MVIDEEYADAIPARRNSRCEACGTLIRRGAPVIRHVFMEDFIHESCWSLTDEQAASLRAETDKAGASTATDPELSVAATASV